MRPRLRRRVDDTRPPPPPPPPPPRWIDIHREAIVARTLYVTRDIKLPVAEKERLIRANLAAGEDD